MKLKLIIVYKPLVFESLKFDCSHKSMHGLALKITVEVNCFSILFYNQPCQKFFMPPVSKI